MNDIAHNQARTSGSGGARKFLVHHSQLHAHHSGTTMELGLICRGKHPACPSESLTKPAALLGRTIIKSQAGRLRLQWRSVPCSADVPSASIALRVGSRRGPSISPHARPIGTGLSPALIQWFEVISDRSPELSDLDRSSVRGDSGSRCAVVRPPPRRYSG